MFSEAMKELITTASILWKVDPDSLFAVIEVESGGKPLVKMQERSEPAITFNKHHFYRRLSGAKLETAIREGLALPHDEPNINPVTQSARWRMLARAIEIDRKAAYEATFWGMGRILGAHWAWLGFGSVDALVREARVGPQGQLSLMMRFIEKADLIGTLRMQDWERFALSYRGPSDDHSEYRKQLAQAYRRQTSRRSGQAQQGSQPECASAANKELPLACFVEAEAADEEVPQISSRCETTHGKGVSTALQRARTWIDQLRGS